MLEKIKLVAYIAGIVFTICCFVQTLLTLAPRVTDLEKRMATTENKVSTIETKIDLILEQSKTTDRKVESIYNIIMQAHTK